LLRKLHFSKIIWRLALGFYIDLQLNATRGSVNDSVYLVFDLEAIQISGAVENELFILDSFLRVVTVNAKPSNSLKFAILSRKSFVTSK